MLRQALDAARRVRVPIILIGCALLPGLPVAWICLELVMTQGWVALPMMVSLCLIVVGLGAGVVCIDLLPLRLDLSRRRVLVLRGPIEESLDLAGVVVWRVAGRYVSVGEKLAADYPVGRQVELVVAPVSKTLLRCDGRRYDHREWS